MLIESHGTHGGKPLVLLVFFGEFPVLDTLQLLPAEVGIEIIRVHHFEALLAGELLGPVTHQHNVFRICHHPRSQVYRVFDARYRSDGAGM